MALAFKSLPLSLLHFFFNVCNRILKLTQIAQMKTSLMLQYYQMIRDHCKSRGHPSKCKSSGTSQRFGNSTKKMYLRSYEWIDVYFHGFSQ